MRIETVELQPTLPPGWHYKQTTTLLEPTGLANLIASTEPLHVDSITTEDYAATQRHLLGREFSGFRELGSGHVTLAGGIIAAWLQFSWTPPDGVPVSQLQMYVVHGGRGYTATGTSASTNWHRFERQFQQVLEDMIVTRVAPPAPGPVARTPSWRADPATGIWHIPHDDSVLQPAVGLCGTVYHAAPVEGLPRLCDACMAMSTHT